MAANKNQNICIKIINGSASDDDKKKFDEWISKSADNKKEFDRILKTWKLAEPKLLPEIPGIENEWNELHNKIKIHENAVKKDISMHAFNNIISIKSLLLKLRPALIGVLTVSVLLSFFLWVNSKNSVVGSQMITVATANKEQRKIILPDSSTIILNSDSKVQYPNFFDDDVRKIKLWGEAFFNVKKDKRRFVVATENACVKVLGTEFNIWSRNNNTIVVVADGKVNFTSKKNQAKSVTLLKNQMSVVVKDSLPALPKYVSPNNILGWLEGRFVFNKTSLEEVVNDLQRNFDISISLDKNIDENTTITGSFEIEDEKTTMQMICTALDLQYENQNGKYLLKNKNDLDTHK